MAKKSDIPELSLIRKRYAEAVEAESHNRESARDDMEFAYVPGSQWPALKMQEYKEEGRPCLEINRMPTFLGRVIGDQRQSQPSIKLRPVDSQGDPETAEVMEGLLRNIESVSNADVAYDTAFEHAVSGGFGYWRITTDYCNELSFEQDIKVEAITNSFSVVFDPLSVKWDKTDAEYCIVHSVISKETHESRYGKDISTNFDITDPTYQQWITDRGVRIAEYIYKKYVTKKIYQLESGESVEEVPKGAKVVKERTAKVYEIWGMKVDGFNILEEPKLWPSKYYPIIECTGKYIYIDGKRYTWSLIRFAKDSQRAYNVTRSRETEMYMMAPLAPFVGTPEQVKGFEDMWQSANRKTYPILLYNPDQMAPGPPRREPLPQISSALANSSQRDVDDMKATVGLFDASIGAQSNETSGVAINARKREGDIGSFPFIDNLGRARELTYKVIMDLIPKIYDTKRVVRVLGGDGADKVVTVNDPQMVHDARGQAIEKVLNDLTIGKYDLTMTMGPSYSTQRQEAAASMQGFIQVAPQTAPLIGDLFAKNMDWPGAQEVARRLKTLVPPQALTQEEREEMAKDMPQEQQQAPPPDPKMVEMQMKMQIEAEKLRMEMDLHELNKMKMQAEIENIRATGVKSLAQAEAAEAGVQMEAYKLELQQLSQNISHQVSLTLEEMRQQNRQNAMSGGNGQGQPGTKPPAEATQTPQEAPNMQMQGQMPGITAPTIPGAPENQGV